MNYSEYKNLFESILNSKDPMPPYDAADYLNYTRLNFSRLKRWDKTLQLDQELVNQLKGLESKQHWIVICEPWCGDAAHVVPFLVRLAEESELVSYELQLRDSHPYLIENYLTNGGKSIPKLIVRDEEGKDIFTWGPRPDGAQKLMTDLKSAGVDFETIKMELQNWYNRDKGQEIFQELKELISRVKVEDQPSALL